MISKNLKTILFGTLLALSMLRATENDTIPPIDDTPIKNTSTNSSSDKAFEDLMRTLKSLNSTNKNLELWKTAILDFKKSLPTDQGNSTLDSIKERILREELVKPRIQMVNKAFQSLKDTSLSTPSTKMVRAYPTNSQFSSGNIPLPKGAKSPLPPIGLIIMQNTAVRENPTLSDERKQTSRLALPSSQGNGLILSPTEEHHSCIGQRTFSASAIETHLKCFIAGQDDAIKSLSFLAHRFLCNKLLIEQGKLAANIPSHCILTGPTGCGKSETLKRLGLFLGVPILYINARSLTDEGFKGKNFSECVAEFCATYNIPGSAIVALDEIDKLSAKKDNRESEMKNFGRAIQQVLLAPLDGSPVFLKNRQIPLKNWWFIGAGAFSDLKGLHDTKQDRTTTVRTQQDLLRAGFEEEFVGRFPTIIPFKGHTIETMVDVISREGSPVQKVKNEFKSFYGVNLIIEEDALRHLASTSIEMNLGVRSLNSVLNFALQPFYEQAQRLVTPESEESAQLTVTLGDITPAIERFKRDNKVMPRDPWEAMSEEAKSMFI